jgi:hypothetical protein
VHCVCANVSRVRDNAYTRPYLIASTFGLNAMPESIAGTSAFHIFVSHAQEYSELKWELIGQLRAKFADEDQHLRVFANEWGLLTGDISMEEIWGACTRAYIGEAASLQHWHHP